MSSITVTKLYLKSMKHPKNKKEIQVKTNLVWKKRLKNYRLQGTNHHILKATGKPCSCDLCSPVNVKSKYNERLSKERAKFNID